MQWTGTTHAKGEPFPGLRLTAHDRKSLNRLRRQQNSERCWRRRIRVLFLLDEGRTLTSIGEAVGCHAREVRRVGWRYLEMGLDAALSEDARPSQERPLDKKTESAVIALACTDPPDGNERWTVRLLAEHVVRRGIVVKIGRETVRRVHGSHDLKPCGKKMWCVSELDDEYIERMEDVLELLARPLNLREPVVALDERPVQLLDASRPGRRGGAW